MFENHTCKCELYISQSEIHVNSEQLYINLDKNTTSEIYKLNKNYQITLVTAKQYESHLMFWLRLEKNDISRTLMLVWTKSKR